MRRLALLATTVAGLAVGGILVAPDPVALRAAGAWRRTCRRRRSSVARPIGFADIVEKVKPAVISVRVKMRTRRAGCPPTTRMPFPKGSPMEQFFKRFGTPEGGQGSRTRRAAASSVRRRAPASSSRPTAMP